MKRLTRSLCLLLLLWVCSPFAPAQEFVRASGAVAVALPMMEAVNILRAEQHVELLLRAPGGTASGLAALGERYVGIALCNREITAVDRANYPELQLTSIPIGVQLVAVAVSSDVWNGGIHSLDAGQLRDIYEGRIANWKELGGPDLKIKMILNEPGRGQWEIFVQWLYGEIRKAPVWQGATAKTHTEMRNLLEFTPGSIALLPPSMVNKENIYPIALRSESGEIMEPTLDNFLYEKYPLSRPLLLVVDDRPTGAVKVVIDFMTGSRGQELVRQCGYVTLAELKAAKELLKK